MSHDFHAPDFSRPTPSLFDEEAQDIAKIIRKNGSKTMNNTTQLRRFYDEICQWYERAKKAEGDEFNALLPYIKMINAKVAYAEGRKLIDHYFASFIQKSLRNVNTLEEFRNFKLFFEAVMGFLKLEELGHK
tara:strand:+ start:332 stop:727 length:396 start_codon:yes stop_codon:yes gene_type:complete